MAHYTPNPAAYGPEQWALAAGRYGYARTGTHRHEVVICYSERLPDAPKDAPWIPAPRYLVHHTSPVCVQEQTTPCGTGDPMARPLATDFIASPQLDKVNCKHCLAIRARRTEAQNG